MFDSAMAMLPLLWRGWKGKKDTGSPTPEVKTIAKRAAKQRQQVEEQATGIQEAPRGMFNSAEGGLRASEPAAAELLARVQSKGRTINYALPGSDELRYLDYMRANANVGGEKMTHILLRQDPRKVEVLEEFLHGTQKRIGRIDRIGVDAAERHVKEFMIRHQKLLGISPADLEILKKLLGN